MILPLWLAVAALFALLMVALVVVIVVMSVRAAQGAARTGPYDGTGGAPLVSTPTALEAAWRRLGSVAGVAWLALVIASVTGVPVLSVMAARVGGPAIWVGALLAALVHLAVHAIGEGTWPRQTGAARRAPLVVRTTGQVVATWPRRVLWGWSAGVLVVAGACSLLGDRTGRGLVVETEGLTSRVTPFPGFVYGLGAVVTVALVLVATEAVLRQVVRRRAVPDVSLVDDLALRRVSTGRIIAGAQLVVAGVLAVILLVAGAAMRDVGQSWRGQASGDVALWQALGWVSVALALAVGIAALVACVLASRRPRAATELPAPEAAATAVI